MYMYIVRRLSHLDFPSRIIVSATRRYFSLTTSLFEAIVFMRSENHSPTPLSRRGKIYARRIVNLHSCYIYVLLHPVVGASAHLRLIMLMTCTHICIHTWCALKFVIL